jgi:hypothetical protein
VQYVPLRVVCYLRHYAKNNVLNFLFDLILYAANIRVNITGTPKVSLDASSQGTRVLAKSMKIAIVNTFFPPRRGGTGAYAYNLAKALAAKGHTVRVFCGSDPLPPGMKEGVVFTFLG